MEERAAEFALGDALQPGVLLLLHDVADVRVFDLPELGLRDRPCLLASPCVEARRRPQQTADVVGAEGWVYSAHARGLSAITRAMQRREFLAALAGTGLAAVAGAQTTPPSPTKGRIKQALMRVNFGRDTKLTFDDMCREAARVGYHGFDLVGPQEWATLKKYGLICTMAPATGVTIRDGLIRPELHDAIERAIHAEI